MNPLIAFSAMMLVSTAAWGQETDHEGRIYSDKPMACMNGGAENDGKTTVYWCDPPTVTIGTTLSAGIAMPTCDPGYVLVYPESAVMISDAKCVKPSDLKDAK